MEKGKLRKNSIFGQISDQNSKKKNLYVVERGAVFGQLLTLRIWIANLNFDKIDTYLILKICLEKISRHTL